MTKEEAFAFQKKLAIDAPAGVNYLVTHPDTNLPDDCDQWSREQWEKYYEDGWEVEPYNLDALIHRALLDTRRN